MKISRSRQRSGPRFFLKGSEYVSLVYEASRLELGLPFDRMVVLTTPAAAFVIDTNGVRRLSILAGRNSLLTGIVVAGMVVLFANWLIARQVSENSLFRQEKAILERAASE